MSDGTFLSKSEIDNIGGAYMRNGYYVEEGKEDVKKGDARCN